MKKSELKEMIKAAMVFEAEDSKKGNKEEQKRMEGAIRDDRDHIKDLEKDIKDNEEKLAKLKKDFKDDVNEGGKYYEDDMDEEMRKDDMDEAKYYEDDMKEAEEVDVEDNEDIDVDIEKDIKVDDEEKEVDVDVKASMPGESEDVEEVQALLMKAQEAASDLGDEKLMDQIGNTITYFTRSQVARVDEMDLDMELDPTDVTKINPEAAAVIGLGEEKDDMDEAKKDMDEEMRKDDMDEEMRKDDMDEEMRKDDMDEEMKSKLPDSIAAAERVQIEKDARKSRGDIKEEEVKENLNEVKRMQKLAGIIK
tara:strand:- start:2065 stop:2988 length:924 start_codon:yes stop_codon:yes gene_type:complete